MKSIYICRTDTTVQRRTSIQVLPVCVLRETKQSGHLNVRTVLRHYVPSKGLRPLRCFAAILVDINCLTNTPLIGGSFLFVLRMHREIDEADTAGRADLGALGAAGTLGVVDRRKVAAHGNRICFAVFRTLHATDTPD